MKKTWLCGIICIIALLLCLGTVGVAYALYSIDATPIQIELRPGDAVVVTLDSLNVTYSGGNVKYGENLDTSKISATANYSDATTKPLTSSEFVTSGFVNTTLGAQTVRVSYTENETTVENTFSVTVVDNCKILGIGGDWDVVDGTALTIYPSNAKEYMITSLKFTAQQTVKVWYNGNWYGYSTKKSGGATKVTDDTNDNLVMPVGTYDIYLDTSAGTLWIEESKKTYTITWADSWATNSSPVFWAWTWGSSTTYDTWYQITKSGSTYYLTVPISSTGCKVLRFDPAIGSNDPDWNSSYKWNESNDNTISNTSSSVTIDFP